MLLDCINDELRQSISGHAKCFCLSLLMTWLYLIAATSFSNNVALFWSMKLMILSTLDTTFAACVPETWFEHCLDGMFEALTVCTATSVQGILIGK